jgi:ankyrin repeat protein
MNHMSTDANGHERCIPCDKVLLEPVVRGMLAHRASYHLTRGEKLEARLWKSQGEEGRFVRWYLRGFDSVESELQQPAAHDASSELAAFLHANHFSGPLDYGPNGAGVPPLLVAAYGGNTMVMKELLDARADANHGYGGTRVIRLLGVQPGITPLFTCAAHGHEAGIRMLLEHKADPNSTIGRFQATLLHGLAALGINASSILLVDRVCREMQMPLNVDQRTPFLGISPLNLAASLSTPEVVAALLQIGADRLLINDSGQGAFVAACQNLRMDIPTLELLWGDGEGVDINGIVVPQTAPAQALAGIGVLANRCMPKSPKVLKLFANMSGLTPLHAAAGVGNLHIVTWLLARGAGVRFKFEARRT